MLRTDFTKIGTLPVWVLSLFFSMIFMGTSLHAEKNHKALGSLACNNQINVSVDDDCQVDVTVEMVLEGEDPADVAAGLYALEIGNYPVNPDGSITLEGKGIYIATVRETTGSNPNSCWGHVNLEDKIYPEVLFNLCPVGNDDPDCILDLTCKDVDLLTDLEFLFGYGIVPVPQVEDNCDDDLTIVVEVVDIYEDDKCEVNNIRLNFIFEDDCQNKTIVENSYYITPIDVSEVNGPVDWYPVGDDNGKIYLSCGSDVDPETIEQHAFEVLRDYYLEYYIDPTPEEIEEVEHYASLYAPFYAYPFFADYSLSHGTILDGTVCNTASVYTDVFIPICGDACEGMGKYIRTWNVYDWCTGESEDFTYVILNFDQYGPDMTVQDHYASVDPWNCWADVIFPGPEHIHDKCGDYTSWSVKSPTGVEVEYDDEVGWVSWHLPKGEYDFIYVGEDCCGNKTEVPFKVFVQDNTPPVAIAKQDIVISLTSNPDGEGIAKLFAYNVDNGSFDGCSDVRLEVRREVDYCDISDNLTYNDDGHSFDSNLDTDDGEFVKFCCQDLEDAGVDEDGDGYLDYALVKVWLRVWDDGDMDGIYGTQGDNFNESWAHVRIEDKLTPVIVCPPDITIGCEEDCDYLDLVGSATAFASCSSLFVDYKDLERDLDGCGAGVVKRQWYPVSRPDITCIQYITKLSPAYYDVTIVFPEDAEIDCTDEVMDDHPWWDVGECNQMAYNLDSDTFYFEEGACYKVLNRWTVIDWCLYDPDYPDIVGTFSDGIASKTQVIKIQDFHKPEFASCEDLMLEVDDHDDADEDGIICENNMVMLTQTATDEGECPSNWLKWTIEVDIWADWNIDYTFSSNLHPDDPFYIHPTQPGEEVKITLPDGVEGSMSNHRVVWKVSDGCGNVTSCPQNFMVVDKTAPTPYCVNLSSAFMENGEVALWACDFNLGSFDNCTAKPDLRYTFTSTPPHEDQDFITSLGCSSKNFTCDDLALSLDGETISVTMYVWDEKDNADYCTVSLSLIDNNDACDDVNTLSKMIAGHVATEEGEIMEDVEITISNTNPDYPISQMTDIDGYYAFDDNLTSTNYMIEGAMNYNHKNGVSTVDIVMIQRHILGIANLTSAYKVIAADASNDEKVTAADLLTIRQLILGVVDEFPNHDSWVFVDAAPTLNFPNPWPYTGEIMVQDLSSNMMNEDFIAIKVGDVNNTAILNVGDDTGTRGADTKTISTADKALSAGEQFEVVLSTEALDNLYGMQFTLEHSGLSVLDISSNAMDLDASNFATITDDLTTFSWNTMQAIDLEGALVSIQFEALQSVQLSDVLAITSSITSAELYEGENLNQSQLELNFDMNGEDVFALYQNVPNPAKHLTSISFVLPESGNASVSIFDVSGKVVKEFDGQFEKGLNTIELNTADLPAAGVWFYTLENGNYSATKRMMIIE